MFFNFIYIDEFYVYVDGCLFVLWCVVVEVYFVVYLYVVVEVVGWCRMDV